MILKALYNYYERKLSIEQIDPIGFITKEIDFVIVIDSDGNFIDLENHQIPKGKKLRGTPFRVPAIGKQAQKHDNSGNDANLLWDKAEFVLGVGKSGKNKIDSFKRVINEYYPNPPEDIKAILKFYENELKKEYPFKAVLENREIGELTKKGTPIFTFRINGKINLVVNETHVVEAIKNKKNNDKKLGVCLITGETNVQIENTHNVIKGISGSQTSGANLVSFNKPSFLSYYKKQSENAPVSKMAAEAYTKGLQSLVDSDYNKIRVADSTIVFWSEKKSEEIDPEEIFPWVIAMQKTDGDNPDRGIEKIEKLFESIFTGKYSQAKTNHFYVLGLSPNAARISVRFWKAPSVEDFGLNIKKHFDDFDIVHGPKEPKYLSLYQILSATALQYKMENVPPNLAGDVIESIIDGTPYPTSLLQQCIIRIRAEQKVNHTRAAILKAYLNRFNKIHKQNEKEITMSLDPNNTNVAYRIGRLFAILEIIQEKSALPQKINTTIRDRFYGAASSSPITVFPRLLSLKNSHIKKLKEGEKIYFEKLIGEILSEVKSFPTNLSLNEQANFAIGYYHQRQDFFTKKSDKEETELINN